MNKDTFWGTCEHNRSGSISPAIICLSIPNLEEATILKSSSHYQLSLVAFFVNPKNFIIKTKM